MSDKIEKKELENISQDDDEEKENGPVANAFIPKRTGTKRLSKELLDIPESKRTNSADRTADSAADWNSLPDNVIEKIAGYVVAKNGCFLKSRYGLSISRRWRWIALRSIKTRTHLQISPSSNMTTPAGNPSFSSVHRELEKKDFSSLKHLEVKNISLPNQPKSIKGSVRAIWRRLQKHNFALKSLKIEESDTESFRLPSWDNGEREQFVIWSSTSACKTLEEICISNSYVSASKELFQKGPMRPLAMLHFTRLKTVRI